MRSLERPRFVVVMTIVTIIALIVLVGGGVMIGKASVDDKGPTPAQLQRANTAAANARGQLTTVKAGLTAQEQKLRASRSRAIKRMHRAEKAVHKLRKRTRSRLKQVPRRLTAPDENPEGSGSVAHARRPLNGTATRRPTAGPDGLPYDRFAASCAASLSPSGGRDQQT